jgi:HlyD family type I secretion membrane fusion protein
MLLLPTAAGFLVTTGFFGFFGTWAVTAPLAGAAVATGQVSPDTNRKSIQHLEGGIVKRIHVHEGSVVSAGDPLVTLEETQARAKLEQYQVQGRMRRARIVRLVTERRNLIDNTDLTLIFPPTVLAEAKTNPGLAELIEGEQEQFEARRNALRTEIELYEQTIRQYEAELVELAGQSHAIQNHTNLIRAEIKIIEGLLKRGYETQTRLRELQRNEASQQAEEAAIRVKMVTAREEMGEARLKIVDLKTRRLDEITEELATARAELLTIQEQIASSRDTLVRMVIRAPVDGTVMNMQMHTQGGVIAPGGVVMDLVPSHDQLIIDAHLNPTDIDVVQPGQKAQIYLTAYPTRHLPSISGVVISVSGDALVDSTTGDNYYLTKVRVAAEELHRLGKGISLIPGMPVEVLIMTQERTLADYLIDPIIQSMRRSFRES